MGNSAAPEQQCGDPEMSTRSPLPTRKLGRPPATSSEETRKRILDAARRCFSEFGYDATTNRQLADIAELTTGAIYHYFDSKLELYIETHAQVQETVYARFAKAIEGVEETFVARIDAVLDEALALNREDPSLASFLLTVRTDSGRHAELAAVPALRPLSRSTFFGDLVALAISTGELHADDAQTLQDVLSALMTGLVAASSHDPVIHQRAADGIRRLVSGSLINQPH